MSIHESQSRFFENIIGRSRGFIHNLLPKLKELFPEQMDMDDIRLVDEQEPSYTSPTSTTLVRVPCALLLAPRTVLWSST